MLSQTIWFTALMAIGRLFVFVFYLEIARRLGPDLFGVFGTQTTYLMVTTILSSFGIDLWLGRHAASHRISLTQIAAFVGLRICFSLIILLAIFGLAYLPSLGKAIQGYERLFLLLIASLLFDHVALTCGAVLEGRQRIRKSAILSLIRALVLAFCGWFLLVRNANLEAVGLAFLCASIVRAGLALFWCRSECQSKVATLKFGWVLAQAAPMAFLNMMVALYFHIDMLMLPEMAGLQQTGIYKVSYTFIEATLMISAAVSTALYPLFSGEHIAHQKKLDQLFLGLKMLWFLGISISAGCLLTGKPLIAFIFGIEGAYPQAGEALMLLSWATPFMFANGVLVRFHLGRHGQSDVLRRVLMIALLNVLLNLVLIPIWGYMGAGMSTILSEAFLTFLLLRLVPGPKKPFLILGLQAMVLGGLVFATAWALSFLPLFAQVLLTAIFIAYFLIKAKWLSISELKSFGRT